MAKAKKPVKPLTYLVHPVLMDTPEIKERIEKGHTVFDASAPLQDGTFQDADLVIGPNCYRIAPETVHLLDIADKAARRSKYGEPKRKGKDDDEGTLAETQV